MSAYAYFKNQNDYYDQKGELWKNIYNNIKTYQSEPDYDTLSKQVLPALDNFYLPRGSKKNISVSFQSKRPEYEKVQEKTFYHSQVYNLRKIESYSSNIPIPNEYYDSSKYEIQQDTSSTDLDNSEYMVFEKLPIRLKHSGNITGQHEFRVMRQIEYDEQEFIKTSIWGDVLAASDNIGAGPDDTTGGHNYLTINILIDDFAEPQLEPFEFEITVPVRGLYKGQPFYSGDLSALAAEILGPDMQTIEIPYRVTSNPDCPVTDTDSIHWFVVELPISANTTIYSAEIISTVDSKIKARISYAEDYPQLFAETEYALPWSTALDSNLKSGKLQGFAVYDPLNAGQNKLSDYYPRDAINRETSMFLWKNGELEINPQVRLSGDWKITLKEAKDLQSEHSALSVNYIYRSEADDSQYDYFTVRLDNTAYIDAYLPVYGWIAAGYKENGYSLESRDADSKNWIPDNFYPEYYAQDYVLAEQHNGYLLGFVKISDRNAENVVRLISAGAKGASEALANVLIGKKVSRGEKTR
ncbi:hypothetical protein RDn1_331, partial [Candidatus Termititenax dinenymphae]